MMSEEKQELMSASYFNGQGDLLVQVSASAAQLSKFNIKMINSYMTDFYAL